MQRLSGSWWRWLVGLVVVGLLLAWFPLHQLLAAPAPAQRLAEAQQRWETSRPSHYRLVMNTNGSCHVDVEIRNEQVVNRNINHTCTYPLQTITNLFGYLEVSRPLHLNCAFARCACRLAIEVRATYDPTFGHPTSITMYAQRSNNWGHRHFWQFLWMNGRLPGCDMTRELNVASVITLQPLP
ncbi:MAG: DUF6174 domain-containing protein [Chloroflexaceae bacterium]|jgi:hypothetical protein|nr:DUF6174 domain-containing protein [Chloroflexaceae bacterium]